MATIVKVKITNLRKHLISGFSYSGSFIYNTSSKSKTRNNSNTLVGVHNHPLTHVHLLCGQNQE